MADLSTAVLVITTVLTVLQFHLPEIRLALWRDPAEERAGQWWRLITALLVQYDPVWMIIVILLLITGIGVLAERLFGHVGWLVIGVVLTAVRDMHGPPLLIGFSLGALLVWRDQHREAQLRQVEAADHSG